MLPASGSNTCLTTCPLPGTQFPGGLGTDDPLGGGLVTGIGFVRGTECMIIANDATVKGGSQGLTSVARGFAPWTSPGGTACRS